MQRRRRSSDVSAMFLGLFVVVALIGKSFSDNENTDLNGRTSEDSSSGEGEAPVVRLGGSLESVPMEEEEIGKEEVHTNEKTIDQITETQDEEEAGKDQAAEDDLTTPSPQLAVAKEEGERSETDEKNSDSSDHGDSPRSDEDGDEVTGGQRASPTVMVWDESVDVVAAVDPDQASAGVNQPKHPPSQERHSDDDPSSDEASPKKEDKTSEEKPERVNDGRSAASSSRASSLGQSPANWALVFTAITASAALLLSSATNGGLDRACERHGPTHTTNCTEVRCDQNEASVREIFIQTSSVEFSEQFRTTSD